MVDLFVCWTCRYGGHVVSIFLSCHSRAVAGRGSRDPKVAGSNFETSRGGESDARSVYKRGARALVYTPPFVVNSSSIGIHLYICNEVVNPWC